MFELVAKTLKPAESVVDVGAGIRPQQMLKAKHHICIEPFHEYADVLEEKGYPVIRADAITGLIAVNPVDTVFMLDVIEHMEKGEGRAALELAKRKGKQVVVFTTLGFIPQHSEDGKDAWGMNGGKWQEHKSGWMPEEFPGWEIYSNPTFHGSRGGAFFAVYG